MSEKRGRPTLYNKELAERICDRIAANGISLAKICAMYDDMPTPETVYQWIHKYPDFSEMYMIAKQRQCIALTDEILCIADNSDGDTKEDRFGNVVCDAEYVARSKIRIETRKWLAARFMPRLFGDKMHVVNDGQEIAADALKRKEELDKKNAKEY